MALKGYEAKQFLGEIPEGVKAEVRRIEGGISAIAAGKINLAAMTATYGPFKTELDAIAAANPNNAAWQAFKAQLDLYVEEFGDAKDWAVLLEDALTGIPKP